MTYTNPKTAAALATLNAQADAVISTPRASQEDEDAAVAEYRRLVNKMIEIQNDAIDAGEYKSDF